MPASSPPPISFARSAADLESQSVAWDEALEPATVRIGSTDYEATVVPSAVRRVPTPEGWQNQQDLRVDVRKTLLEERPGLGVSIKWQGLTFSLDSCGGDEPDSLCWTIRANRIC